MYSSSKISIWKSRVQTANVYHQQTLHIDFDLGCHIGKFSADAVSLLGHNNAQCTV